MEYNVGDIVKTKKQHPCGSKIWEITRIGVDFKLKCKGCGHTVILPREKALKAITKKISIKDRVLMKIFSLRPIFFEKKITKNCNIYVILQEY